MTALAHSQWSYVLRPGIDSVIDATAGNGWDSLVLAKLLFEPFAESSASTQSNLLCVDVDRQACHNTRQRLQPHFPQLLDRSIHILERSHDPLPLPMDASSIGLVTYNLGYLPHAKAAEASFVTQASSTLSSLAQAARALRVGGMLSVMTYPATNAQEDAVVRAFATGLALFSSQTSDWTTHLYIGDEWQGDDDGVDWNRRVLRYLQEVHEPTPTTWRVQEHRKLGWTDAPVLLTATRIK